MDDVASFVSPYMVCTSLGALLLLSSLYSPSIVIIFKLDSALKILAYILS